MHLRKLLLILVCILSMTSKTEAQNTRVKSLDVFFGGIPVSEGIHSCTQHILKDSTLGIDSITPKGIYSSFKPEKKNHFPFPDTVEVKIILVTYKGGPVPTFKELPVGSKGIAIAGIFGTDKQSRKTSDEVYKQLKKKLADYYAKAEEDGTEIMYFSKGLTKDFPDCSLIKYPNAVKRYCVILEYWESKK